MKKLAGIRTLLLGAALAAVLASPCPAATETVGIILFIGGQPQPEVPVAVAELRSVALSACSGELLRLGHEAGQPTDLQQLRETWRVRSDRGLKLGFLSDCREQAGLGSLLIVNLISQNGQFQLLARRISCPEGFLLGAAVGEVRLGAAEVLEDGPAAGPAPDWRRQLALLARGVLPAVMQGPRLSEGGNADRHPLIMMTAGSVATSAELAAVAGHLFIDQVLRSGQWTLVDPGVAAATLIEAGLEPLWLGPDARALLQRRFGADSALLPELISYDMSQSGRLANLVEDAPRDRTRPVRDYSLSLRLVELDGGTVGLQREVFCPAAEQVGWFGRQDSSTLLHQMTRSTRELWLKFYKDLEAS